MNAAILPLRVEDLSYRAQGRMLLDHVSFTLGQGTRTIILGHNGAGKSLLLRLCHGLIEPSGGRIVWQGPGGDDDPARRQAMVFQRPVMLRRSAWDNIDYALSLRGLPRAARRPLVDEALAAARLSHLARSPARVLSGGEQQRLALARAWALRPQILFLDEPTSSLDPGATRAVEELILSIDAAGCKIVMTTHDLGQARRLATEILFLHRGRLAEQTPAADFFARPASAAARAFIAGELPDEQ